MVLRSSPLPAEFCAMCRLPGPSLLLLPTTYVREREMSLLTSSSESSSEWQYLSKVSVPISLSLLFNHLPACLTASRCLTTVETFKMWTKFFAVLSFFSFVSLRPLVCPFYRKLFVLDLISLKFRAFPFCFLWKKGEETAAQLFVLGARCLFDLVFDASTTSLLRRRR